MQRDKQSAFLVALHRDLLLPRPGPGQPRLTGKQRRLLLRAFLGARFDGRSRNRHERQLHDLQRTVQKARQIAAEAAQNFRKRVSRARFEFEGTEIVLRPLLDGLRLEFEREVAVAPGTQQYYRVKLPLNVVYAATTLESAIGLAVIEEITGARNAGQCPYCKDWWFSPDGRRRRTCGKDLCDAARKREWRRTNPEPAEQVATRVRRHRKIQRLKKERAKRAGRGA